MQRMARNQERLLDDRAFEGLRLDVDRDPTEIKEEIGKGTYGRVFKVKFRGTVQAAKELHLKGKKLKDKKETLKNFLPCAQLRHNNLVWLFGMYENKTVQPATMMLIIELMDCSLSSLLECGSEIENSTKLSILLDVSSGLKYLHTQDPPIAHVYLSSNNVLLTADRKAKISDVGVAQLATCASEKKVSPKALPFMAPELYKSPYGHGLSSDVFSFGVVMLHTVTQKQLTVVSSTKQTKQLEFDYQSQFDQVVADSFFKQLKELVKSCLYNDPKNRPQINLVSEVIENMTKHPDLAKSLVISHDNTESSVTSHDHGGHDEVQQTLNQVSG